MVLFRLFLIVLLAMTLSPVSAQAFKCNVALGSFNFGNYAAFSTVPLDSAASLSVTCNNPTQGPNAQPLSVMVTLSPGNGSYGARYMSSVSGGTDQLYYNLSTTPSHSDVWGDGTGGSRVVTGLVTKESPLNATIYGRIPSSQNIAVGSYSDLITVTVIW